MITGPIYDCSSVRLFQCLDSHPVASTILRSIGNESNPLRLVVPTLARVLAVLVLGLRLPLGGHLVLQPRRNEVGELERLLEPLERALDVVGGLLLRVLLAAVRDNRDIECVLGV